MKIEEFLTYDSWTIKREFRVRRGFAAQRNSLLTELRELELEITHWIISCVAGPSDQTNKQMRDQCHAKIEATKLKLYETLAVSLPPPEKKPARYQPPADQICANCGAVVPGSDLGLISQAIRQHKPVCSYECNKALGQVD